MQAEFKSSGLRAKWVRPESIHLTLKFLGNIDPGDIDKIGKAMTDAVKILRPFTLVAGGVGVFPGVKRPRVIWVGLGRTNPAAFCNAAQAGGAIWRPLVLKRKKTV